MESTFKYTFQDLYKDVLNYMGKDRDTSDSDLLTKAKRRTNDAYRKFLGLDWQFLSEFAKLTVEAGKYIYELPDDYGTIRTPFILVSNSGEFQNPTETSIKQIWQEMSCYPYSGAPQIFAFGTSFSENIGVRVTAWFWPIPHKTLVYNYEYKKVPNILVEDTDLPYCPSNLSHILREFCLAEVEQFDEESNRVHTTNLYNILLPQAIKENSIRTPNSVGNMGGRGIREIHPKFGNSITMNNETYGV